MGGDSGLAVMPSGMGWRMTDSNDRTETPSPAACNWPPNPQRSQFTKPEAKRLPDDHRLNCSQGRIELSNMRRQRAEIIACAPGGATKTEEIPLQLVGTDAQSDQTGFDMTDRRYRVAVIDIKIRNLNDLRHDDFPIRESLKRRHD
jgi:hypothetical protein